MYFSTTVRPHAGVNPSKENLFGVAIRRGQDHPDEYGKMDGQGVKRGVVTPRLSLERRVKIPRLSPILYNVLGHAPAATQSGCVEGKEAGCE